MSNVVLETPKHEEESRATVSTLAYDDAVTDIQTRAVEMKNEEIMQRDADVPLCEHFRGRYGADTGELPPRMHVKRLLYNEMRRSYPYLDHLMVLALVENYLEHPDDTPEKLLERAPKLNPPDDPPLSKEDDESRKDMTGFDPEGSPGGRGALFGDLEDMSMDGSDSDNKK